MAHIKNGSELGAGSKPPMCNKDKFANWKVRMQAYMDAIDDELFETVLNGPYIPKKLAPTIEDPNKMEIKQKSEWTDNEKKAVQLDKKAKNILFQSLEDELFENVVNCKTAQEVWETLLIMHEGTEEVRENKQSLLIQQYEMFNHVPGENLTVTYERFTLLLNSLRSFGKIYPNRDLIIKFMRALPSKWDAKTTAIRESKNLHEMNVQKLYGNLLTYELELTQRAETLSEGRKKEKNIALKASTSTHKSFIKEDSESEDDESNDDEGAAMLVRQFKKFINRNSRQRRFRNNSKEQTNEVCYNCKKPGHFIAQCGKPLREELARDRKKSFPKKKFKSFSNFKKKKRKKGS